MPPTPVRHSVKNLALDLANFRTIQQASEADCVQAMVTTSPDWFWTLTKSLLESGYLPTDNIIVLKSARGTLVVKEGNRRIAALKLVHKVLPRRGLVIPDDVSGLMDAVTKQWLDDNETVPCSVFEHTEAETVDRIVTLAHGKGEKAGRDPWNAVARARHNRARGEVEPALDLLEAYLKDGRNITDKQRALWAGDYPYSVLDEAMKKLAPRLGLANSPALARGYPNVQYRDALETILYGIGQRALGFPEVRGDDFAVAEGIPPAAPKGATSTGGPGGGKAGRKTGKKENKTKKQRSRAYSLTDPRSVEQKLRGFAPRGKDRDKVATLAEEATELDLETTPLALCFVLRSMFEISAWAYCTQNNIPRVKANGREKTLKDILLEVIKHLIGAHPGDKDFEKALHGARTQLAQSSGLLSVTSMNALVHNPKFHVTPRDIATLFHQVFPLIEAMNS